MKDEVGMMLARWRAILFFRLPPSAFILLLTACSTSLDSGTTHFRTFANTTSLVLTAPGVSLTMSDVNHSTPTHTAFNGAAQFLGTAGAAALPFTRTTNIVKAAAIIPAAIVPAFRMTPSTQANVTVTMPVAVPQIRKSEVEIRNPVPVIAPVPLRPLPAPIVPLPLPEPAPVKPAPPIHIEKQTPPVIDKPIETL